MPKSTPPTERFWSYVVPGDPDECWEWTGNRLKGYGRFGYGGGTVISAHRFSYELHIGPIPAGLEVLHSCDNPPCVNPAHLRAGTHRENMQDMASRGRHGVTGENNPHAKLTAEKVRAARTRLAAGESWNDIANDFGVSRFTIADVRSGRTWRHVQ